jgi:plasmid replication initiation protein
LYIDSNEGNRTIWENLYLTVLPETLKECGNVTEVFKDAEALKQKTIYINREDEEVSVGWINYVKRIKKTGVYEIEVSKEILPELVEQARKFHTYELTVAISLKSVYSQRIYELCSQYKNYQDGYFFRTLEELKKILALPVSYEDFSLLKARVLEPARKEIKALYDSGECDLYFEYRVKDKKRKKVLSISFKVMTKEREAVKSYSPEDAIFYIRTSVAPCFRNDKKFIERIVKAIQLNPDISLSIVTKLSEKINKYPHKEVPAIIRYVLNEDFQIK